LAAVSFFVLAKNEFVLSAIDAVIVLNKEAGVNTDSSTGLVSEGKEKSDFDEFCIEIMACVHKCFSHFSKVLLHLGKERAQLRSPRAFVQN
jgi:hypothetical protein